MEKVSKSSFEMIFDNLSNAFFRFSLRRLGAKLERGRLAPPPPAVRESLGAPTRRGLKKNFAPCFALGP